MTTKSLNILMAPPPPPFQSPLGPHVLNGRYSFFFFSVLSYPYGNNYPDVHQNSLRKGAGTYSLQQILTIGQIAVTAKL